jgi:hypothetical protein
MDDNDDISNNGENIVMVIFPKVDEPVAVTKEEVLVEEVLVEEVLVEEVLVPVEEVLVEEEVLVPVEDVLVEATLLVEPYDNISEIIPKKKRIYKPRAKKTGL